MIVRLASLLVCAAMVAGCGVFGPAPWERSTSRPAMSQIAYVGSDDQVYIAEADGSSARLVTRQVSGLSTEQGWAYRWPTYSPDGRRLAFAGYRTGASQLGSAAVLVSEVGHENATALLESAGMATIYLYWSPDSRHLAALLQQKRMLPVRVSVSLDPQSSGGHRLCVHIRHEVRQPCRQLLESVPRPGCRLLPCDNEQ